MSELPNRDAFSGCLHTRFHLSGVLPPDGLDLELEEVSELQVSRRQQTFSMLFRGPADRMLPQHIYRLKHALLGEMDLFLVPVGQRGESILYETVFNHLVPEP